MKRNMIILGIMILFLLVGCGGMGVMVGERALRPRRLLCRRKP